jgi:hypothetical protein
LFACAGALRPTIKRPVGGKDFLELKFLKFLARASKI